MVMFLFGALFGTIITVLVITWSFKKIFEGLEIRYLRMVKISDDTVRFGLNVLKNSFDMSKTYVENVDEKEYNEIYAAYTKTMQEAREKAVIQVKSILPYHTKYSNWKEAVDYLKNKGWQSIYREIPMYSAPKERLEILRLVSEYCRDSDNIHNAERLFMAISALRWAYSHATNDKMLEIYLGEIERHLRGEITLYWQNGVIKIKIEGEEQ